MSFKKSSVLITGGSKGIGLSIAKMFAEKTDHPLVLIARNTSDLEKAKQQCLDWGAPKVETISADLTSEKEIAAIDFRLLKPGILVNNAGVFLFKQLADTTAEEFDRQYRLNTFSTFNITKQVLPVLKEQERGLIVNICSQASKKGYGDSGAYTMSKHALLGYTRSLRKELAKNTNIAVTAVNLGQTYSTSWEGVDIETEKLIDPEDVGRMIVSLSELSPRSVVEEIDIMPQGGEVKPM
ncbi:MAG: SDR family oxidoreductase [Balneola sp.]|nr:SDR family oxidoreductase [Balneola sp.]